MQILTPRSDPKTEISPVVALHCSGHDSRQWDFLRRLIEPSVRFHAFDLIGTPARGPWKGGSKFGLQDEAVALVAHIARIGEPVHIVGHSFGGALGLHLAGNQPKLVRSLCLYEPTTFSLLKTDQAEDGRLLKEIETLASDIQAAVEQGCSEFAASLYTDFWGGVGSWQTLSRARRQALAEWIPKVVLDFQALIDEPAQTRNVSAPTTLMVGSQSHPHTQRIVEILTRDLDQAKQIEVPGADHLGPFRFRDCVAGVIWRHLLEHSSTMDHSRLSA